MQWRPIRFCCDTRMTMCFQICITLKYTVNSIHLISGIAYIIYTYRLKRERFISSLKISDLADTYLHHRSWNLLLPLLLPEALLSARLCIYIRTLFQVYCGLRRTYIDAWGTFVQIFFTNWRTDFWWSQRSQRKSRCILIIEEIITIIENYQRPWIPAGSSELWITHKYYSTSWINRRLYHFCETSWFCENNLNEGYITFSEYKTTLLYLKPLMMLGFPEKYRRTRK